MKPFVAGLSEVLCSEIWPSVGISRLSPFCWAWMIGLLSLSPFSHSGRCHSVGCRICRGQLFGPRSVGCRICRGPLFGSFLYIRTPNLLHPNIPPALFWHCEHHHHSLVSTIESAGFSLHYNYLRCTFACEVWWISHAFHAGFCSFHCICPINLTF